MKHPFDIDDPKRLYEVITDPNRQDGLPHWPPGEMQKTYVGSNGPQLVSRSISFLNILAKDGAFQDGWKGLDYACGFGRFASLLTVRGKTSQLDLVDAWQRTLDLLPGLNIKNKYWLVSEMLQPGEIPSEHYSTMLAFSVFTHLSNEAFLNNLDSLYTGLQAGGTAYITVRHDEFADHKFSSEADEICSELARDGFWFRGNIGNRGKEPIFGDMIINKDYIDRLGARYSKVEYLGKPHDLQHVYAIRK